MSEEKLSTVKKLILEALRKKKYTHFAELLELTKQKHFDRRIRELKSELGYDIEVVFKDGDPHYTLKSEKKNPTVKRTYLKKSDKDSIIFESSNNCTICDKKFSKKYPKVLDHRIPVIRGGDGTSANFQVICHPCNNQKRSQCRGCKLDCTQCFLAFPDKYEANIVLNLNKNFKNEIEEISKNEKMTPSQFIEKILIEKLKK